MTQLLFSKFMAKPARKKTDKTGSSTQFPATVEDHAKSRSIKNPWNCFLLEAKAIRDYFVQEEAPSQGSSASDPAFFNSLRFQGRFIPLLEERYQLRGPAISNFFRHRFIVNESKETK